MRTSLFALPCAAVAFGALVGRVRWLASAATARVVAPVLVLALGAAGHGVVSRAAEDMRRQEGAAVAAVAGMAELVEGREGIVIARRLFGAQFAVDHYPVKWCMVPLDERSLLAVAARHEIAAALMPWPVPERHLGRLKLGFEEAVLDPETDAFRMGVYLSKERR